MTSLLREKRLAEPPGVSGQSFRTEHCPVCGHVAQLDAFPSTILTLQRYSTPDCCRAVASRRFPTIAVETESCAGNGTKWKISIY